VSEKARFRFSAQDGIFEIEATEEFVTRHFESLIEIVKGMSTKTVVETKHDSVDSSECTSSRPKTIADYPEVFSEINGKLKIVKDIPGESKKEKMTNIAMLFCFGNELMGNEQISSKDIREICEQHGCLDGPNFSKIFDDTTIFLSDGVKGGIKQVKLTFNGKKKTEALLKND